MEKCPFMIYGCKGAKKNQTLNEHKVEMMFFHRDLINFIYSNRREGINHIEIIQPDLKKEYYYNQILNEENEYGAHTEFYVPISQGFTFFQSKAILNEKNGIMYGRYPINQKTVNKICYFKFDFINNEQRNFIKNKDYKIGISIINENFAFDNNIDINTGKWFLTNEIIKKEIPEEIINKINSLVIKFQVLNNCELIVDIIINDEKVKQLKKWKIKIKELFYPFFEIHDLENFSDFNFRFNYE